MTRRLPLAVVLVIAAIATTGCAGPTTATFPPLGSTPAPAGDASGATTRQVIGALAAAGLQAAVSNRPFRPPEGALLAATPRTVLEVPLPDDPDPGWIIVYAAGSEDQAARAAKDQAAYLASGPGRAMFVNGTRFVLRVVGSTVVWFSWSPDGSPDKRTATIAQTLEAIGTGIDIPS
jgi:hypothetical protein